MGYSVAMTRAGYALQAALFAEDADLVITRVEVGSGALPEDADPAQRTGLIAPEAAAVCTSLRREGCDIHLTVEYRSDLNGGLEKAFLIREFGVFALGADGEEILLLYGDLSDYPEPAVPLASGGGSVRRYPVAITVGPGAKAELAYPPGAWVTHQDLLEFEHTAAAEAVRVHDRDLCAHANRLHVVASRQRDAGRPDYGLEGGGAAGTLALETGPYTGAAAVSVQADGALYDARNAVLRDGERGTLILQSGRNGGYTLDRVLVDGAEYELSVQASGAGYVRTFRTADWQQDGEGVKLTVPAADHGQEQGAVCRVYALADGVYQKGFWAAMETTAAREDNGDITLRSPAAYDGAAVIGPPSAAGGGTASGADIATDQEVDEVLDGIFGSESK